LIKLKLRILFNNGINNKMFAALLRQ